MADAVTQAMLDERAEAIADLLDELPWCQCIGFMVVEEEGTGDPNPALNQYLQAFDVLVFDGYVTDFTRIVRELHQKIEPAIARHDLDMQLTVDYHNDEDPNRVPLSLMVHYHGADEAYLPTRRSVLEVLESVVDQAVAEWTQEEENEGELVETLV